jgi:hypothetical protein
MEVGVRFVDMARGESFFTDYRNRLNNTKPLLPFRSFGFPLYKTRNGEKFISSRHGELYPFHKKENTVRIVCFGGSTTENLPAYNKNRTHYPKLLEELLNKAIKTKKFEVINVGNSAYATPHSIILLLLNVISWNPDIVILSHNINDLLVSYFPGFEVDYTNKYGTQYYLPDYEKKFTTLNVLFQHSSLYWFIYGKIENMQSMGSKLQRKSYGDLPSQSALKIFERNLTSFVNAAKFNHIKVVLGSQPLQNSKEMFEKHMAYKPYNRIAVYPLHKEFIKHHQAFNNVIKNVAQKLDVLFVDNDKALSGEEKYFVDFVHYTTTGIEVLANSYSKSIQENQFITRDSER